MNKKGSKTSVEAGTPPILIGGQEYRIAENISVDLYERVIPIIDELPQEELRSPDLKLGEITKMLAQRKLLKKFVAIVLGQEEKKMKDIGFDDAMNVVVNFFLKNASSMILSGIFYLDEQAQMEGQTTSPPKKQSS